ncbi:hypothetical protein AUK22_03935 [bacterium CG2_30_54_10]|nr:MAG: hypothetical protein AUK22_03935 [bacterium CG2_30_54_10]
MLNKDGIISLAELAPLIPSESRLKKGPVAMAECIQDIPCDPCVLACPRHAITMKAGITDQPHLDQAVCNGCTLCVASCPGLAIFVVNMAHAPRSATVTLPYEMLPVPKEGEVVAALDRSGKTVCEAKVLKVMKSKVYDRTLTITIEIPKDLAMSVRAIRAGVKVGRK